MSNAISNLAIERPCANDHAISHFTQHGFLKKLKKDLKDVKKFLQIESDLQFLQRILVKTQIFYRVNVFNQKTGSKHFSSICSVGSSSRCEKRRELGDRALSAMEWKSQKLQLFKETPREEKKTSHRLSEAQTLCPWFWVEKYNLHEINRVSFFTHWTPSFLESKLKTELSILCPIKGIESSYLRQMVPCHITKQHPDYYPVLVLTEVLSGTEGPLWNEIRN